MKTRHTLGPWRWWACKETESASNDYIQIAAGLKHVAQIKISSITKHDMNLIAAAPDLLEACRNFVEWLDREDAGFDHKTHNRETPEGEAAWREWFYGNLALCRKAQDDARAAIAKVTGEQV